MTSGKNGDGTLNSVCKQIRQIARCAMAKGSIFFATFFEGKSVWSLTLMGLMGVYAYFPANQVSAQSVGHSLTNIRISEVNTPWTNQSGQVVPTGGSPLSVTGTRTSEWTSIPSQSGAVMLTQGVLPLGQQGLGQPGLEQPLSSIPSAMALPSVSPSAAQVIPVLPTNNQAADTPSVRKTSDQFLHPDQVIPQKAPQSGNRQVTLPDGRPLELHEQSSANTAPSQVEDIGQPISGIRAENNQGTTNSIFPSPYGLGGSRRKDGTMIGNPYAIGDTNSLDARCYAGQYHPGQFPHDPTAADNRFGLPQAAYGTDGWGNSAYNECGGDVCGNWGWCSGILKNTQFSFGLVGYTTPMDLANQGNFGGDIALNWATPKRYLLGLSAQAGGRVTTTGQGYFISELVEQEKKNTQLFWTSGVFYRNPSSPWKFGVVYDSINSTYYSKYTLGQVRAELSRSISARHDIGFRGAFRINNALVNWWRADTEYAVNARSLSYYTGFVRHYFDMGGEGMLFGGVTDRDEGLLGGQIEVPISNYASLKNSFTYVCGKEEGFIGTKERTWNVSVSLVVYFGGNCRESLRNPLRPLFDVADNGTLLQTYRD